MAKFKVGDIVQLKSGGPSMTISHLSSGDDPKYSCTWFNGKKLEHGQFLEETLQESEKK